MTGIKVTSKHVHACLRQHLPGKLRVAYGATMPAEGVQCPFEACDKHCADADMLGAQIDAHTMRVYDKITPGRKERCRMREGDTVCDAEFADRLQFVEHVEEQHGFYVARAGQGGIRADSVQYCDICSKWLIEEAREHYAFHSTHHLSDVDSPLSCSPQILGAGPGDPIRQAWCAFCLLNEDEDDMQRWRVQ